MDRKFFRVEYVNDLRVEMIAVCADNCVPGMLRQIIEERGTLKKIKEVPLHEIFKA